MTKYRVIVQVYKEFTLDAPSALDAKRMAEEEIKKSGTTDKYNVNEAKDLDRAREKKEERVRKLKEKKAAGNKAEQAKV